MSTPPQELLPFEDGLNIAFIPIPHGLTPEQFFALQSSLVSLSITAAIAFTIIIWDYFYLLPNEFHFYQRAKKAEWRTLAPWSFMILRCSAIVSILATLCISSFQSGHCEVGLAIAQWASVVVTATSGIAFGYRVMSMWRTHRTVVAAIVALTYLIMIGAWVAVASQYRARTGPSTPFASNCQILPFIFWAPASHASSALFNVIALILVLLKFVDQRVQNSVSGFRAYREALTHIALATGASVTVFVIHILPPDYQLAKRIVLPYSTLITATMGARVFLISKVAVARVYPVYSVATWSQGDGWMTFRLTPAIRPDITGGEVNKVAHASDAASPIVTSKPSLVADGDDFAADMKSSPSSYTSFPFPTYKHSALSPSSAFRFPPLPSSRLPRSFPLSPHASPSTPPLRLNPSLSIDSGKWYPAPLATNPYTTFPSPPQPTSSPRSSSSIDMSTSLLKSKFGTPSLLGGKKDKKEKAYKSGWM